MDCVLLPDNTTLIDGHVHPHRRMHALHWLLKRLRHRRLGYDWSL